MFSLSPLTSAALVGIVLLLGFALPPLLNMVAVSPLRVLRRDLPAPKVSGLARYGIALLALFGVAVLQAKEIKLAVLVLLGTLALITSVSLLCWFFLHMLKRALRYSDRHHPIMQGLKQLAAKPLGTAVQMAALAVGVMAVLMLTQVAGDLFKAWRNALPTDAPNQFLINILPPQAQPLSQHFAQHQVKGGTLYPMIRARLTAINGQSTKHTQGQDDRARRLIEREFNLSESADLMPSNHIVAGKWFTPGEQGSISLEESIVQNLKLKLGDTLSFDQQGEQKTFTLTSIRKVDWDSFRVNFFAMVPVGSYRDAPASLITAIRAPDSAAENKHFAQQLLAQFPNILSIDIG
ncbi:MAG: hypothetical protein RLZZ502_1678, partial [Pseudomonadota bacterium]